MALPTSLRAPEMESLGHGHSFSSRGHVGILHQYNHRQDPGMYTERANLRQKCSRALHRVGLIAIIFGRAILTTTSVSALLNASGLFNTITDYIILLLPMHAAYKLQMNRTKKLLVVAVFTFGLW